MLKFILVVVAGYCLLVAVVYLMQGRMLYLSNVPGRALAMTPADAGFEYQDVAIETADGEGRRHVGPQHGLVGKPDRYAIVREFHEVLDVFGQRE